MSLLIMQHSVDFDLEEIESRLYSQVFHSTENWDQTPDHPVLNKVPERERQVTTYSISNQVNTTRYWDATTQGKTPISSPSNENTVNNSAVISVISSNETTENITKPNETNDNDSTLQNNNDKNTTRKVGAVEEYIGLDSTNNQNENLTNKIDFTKDDFHHQQNFFYNSQNKLIQQNEIQKTPNILNNNTSTTTNESDPFAELKNNIKALAKENTPASRKKANRLKRKLKYKEIKHARRVKRQIKEQAKEEKRLRKLGIIPNNNLGSFSFVNQFNNIHRNTTNKNFNVYNSPEKSNKKSPIAKKTEINDCTKNQQEIINDSVKENSLVILSDSDSDSDEVIEVPLPEDEIVCIDSSSESSDTDDTICVDDSIVENIPSITLTSNVITEENNVPNSPKLETSNDYETTEITNETQLKSDGEIINDTNCKNEQILNSEEDKIEEIKVMKDIEENATTLFENEDKIDETINSPKQTTNKNTSNTSINEIEKERAELLCTPDSNTNDFMAHDVCNLNKNNFCFNFNLHDSDLDLSGKEITKAGPSITDVYETESSCSEAGTSKNRSYFSEVDFESPIKEIFAEPDLAKFSSFITPIRNRNISNVANSFPDLSPIKTKAGIVNSSSFQLDIFNKNTEDSNNSDEYNSDPTTLSVKKKIKKKKKKAKKKDTNENDKTDENIIQGQTETTDNTEVPVNKTTKKNKKRNKAITYEELKRDCFLLNQPDSEKEKMSKTKEKKLKKKNKRKSGQLETGSDNDSSNKKPKNNLETKQNEENKNVELPNEKLSTTINKDKSESLPKSVSKPLEELNSTVEYYDKVESYFADDILYKELETKNKTTNNVTKTETQIVNDKDNSSNELINIDTLSNSSATNIETFKCMNNFGKSNENETQIISISSDSDTEVMATPNEVNTSSSSGNNIVLNIFSPKKVNDESSNSKDMVANPFSFVQNYEKLNHKRSFKDFWTNDMKSFYNDSWGHEDYDLTAVHQSMPSDFSKWSVNVADQYPVKGKKRGPMCLRCREFGHIQFRCPKIHEAVICSTCGDSEHTTSRCPKSICTTCRSSTQHHTTSCNNCSNNYKTIRCPICNYIGHLSRDCPDLWRRYHLTTNDNNTLEVSNQMLKPPNMLWCSNCANRGHSANDCNYLRTDHFPTYPGIQNYTPVYNNVPFLHDLQSPEQQIPVRIFENVNLHQIHNHRIELIENNNKKYLNMIKHLRRYIGHSVDHLNINVRLNYLQNAASGNRFNKRNVGELYKISKMLRGSR